MTYETISVEPLSPVIGAEIKGVDLSKPLGNQQFKEIHDALTEHLVIFFRDQEIDLDQQKDFGRRFGKLHIHPTAPAPEGHPEVLIIKADAKSKAIAGNRWHTDVSCDAEPPMGSILHMRELPPSGGDTMFANMYEAYDRLTEPMKQFLGGLKAWHESEHVHRGTLGHTKLREGLTLDAALTDRIKRQIRDNTTPRHVPALVLQVSDIPRTKSGKIVELAVRNVVHGRAVKNLEALANPEALQWFSGRPELSR